MVSLYLFLLRLMLIVSELLDTGLDNECFSTGESGMAIEPVIGCSCRIDSQQFA